MPPKQRQLKLTPSPEFLKWFEEYKEKWGMGDGEALALMITDFALENGFEGEVMNKRGTYDRKMAGLLKRVNEITDKGAYDPIHYNEDTKTFDEE
jgi:hypothetical protein